MARAVPNLCVSRKVFLKHHYIRIQFVVQCRICHGVEYGLHANNPVEDFNEHLLLLIGRFAPTKVTFCSNQGDD